MANIFSDVYKTELTESDAEFRIFVRVIRRSIRDTIAYMIDIRKYYEYVPRSKIGITLYKNEFDYLVDKLSDASLRNTDFTDNGYSLFEISEKN